MEVSYHANMELIWVVCGSNMELAQNVISNDIPVMFLDGVKAKGMSKDFKVVATRYRPRPFPPVARSRP